MLFLTVLHNLEALLIFKALMEWQSAGISNESLSSAVVLSSSLSSLLDIERTTLGISWKLLFGFEYANVTE